jgi:hypothetical protein
LDGGEVVRRNVKCPVVVANKQVENGVAQATSHGFDDLVWDWWDAGVADGDGVEWLEVVDKSKGTTLLLHTEPPGVVRHVGMLVHACSELLTENLDNIFQNAWRDGEVLVCLWDMFNDWDLNW